MSAEVTLVLSCTEKFREALRKASKDAGIPMTQFMREAIAKSMKYDLTGEPVGTQTPQKKYNSPEERERAHKEAQKARNDLQKKLLKEYRERVAAAEKAKAIVAMLGSLKTEAERWKALGVKNAEEYKAAVARLQTVIAAGK